VFSRAVIGGSNFRASDLRACPGDPEDYEVFVSYDVVDPLRGAITMSGWYLFFPPYDINGFFAGRCG
jgi:hypothetical protein